MFFKEISVFRDPDIRHHQGPTSTVQKQEKEILSQRKLQVERKKSLQSR